MRASSPEVQRYQHLQGRDARRKPPVPGFYDLGLRRVEKRSVRSRRHTGSRKVFGIMRTRVALGAAVVLAGGIGAGCSGGSSPGDNGNGGTVTSVTAATAPPQSTIPGHTATTLFGSVPANVQGSSVMSRQATGNMNIAFSIPSGSKWDLVWAYDCPGGAAPGGFGLGNFIYTVYKNGKPDKKDIGTGGSTASGSGVQKYSDSGSFQVRVGAKPDCVWSVNAVALNS
jgi:hypothetical protein